MKLRLVVPVDVDSPTGGNVYDLAVARTLRGGGHDVDVVRSRPDQLSEVLRRPWSGSTLVDGLLACPAPGEVAGTGVGVLVHMPRAWEAGLSPDQVREADERERQALQAASVVVATSQWSAAYLRQRHGLGRVAVAPPGVDAAPVVTGSDPLQIVYVAALLPNKEQLTVVEALSGLHDLPWRLRLAGSWDRHPAYAHAVRGSVGRRGLAERVEMVGEVCREDAWAGADLGLLVSRAEAFGMVVAEALARGIPAVVSDGGAAEALGVTPDGRRPGLVVPPGDVDALTSALHRWLNDARHRADLRERALARRLTLDGWDTTSGRVLDALRAD